MQPAYSYCASSDPRVHFGLGSIDRVDRLRVTWPDGRTQRLEDVAADQILRVKPKRHRSDERVRDRERRRWDAADAGPSRPRLRAVTGWGRAGRSSTLDAGRDGGGHRHRSARSSVLRAGPVAQELRRTAGDFTHAGLRDSEVGDLGPLDRSLRAAIEDRVAAVRRNPTSADAYGELGRLYHSHGYYSLARRSYQIAHRLAPRDAWPYYLGVLACRPARASNRFAVRSRWRPTI